MSYDIPKFLKRENESLLFNGEGELIYYIPEVYFERKFAIVMGEYVNLMGIFDYTIVDKNGKNNGLHRFNFPTVFLCRPGKMEKVKNIKLTDYTDPEDYRLLKFSKGDQVVVSVKVPKMVENAEEFYNMFIYEKLPNTIPYNELHNYFIENIQLNGANYGLSIQMFGIIVSELCRDKNDPSKLFRHTSMKHMNDYRAISIKQAPKYISPFAAVTSENWDESVVNAIVNKNAKDSPLEKLLML